MTISLRLTDPEPAGYLLLARCEDGKIVSFEQLLRLDAEWHYYNIQLIRE
jgi:hypothetical protein